MRESAISTVRAQPLWRLLSRAPALGVWAVLYPLAARYGLSTRNVYTHITDFVGEDFSDTSSRNDIKARFRRAARHLGLPVSGNEPTDLFFAPLGPAHSQHPDLARAFVGTALHVGPPAIEDTPAARAWQRRAVRDRCPTLTRLHATIDFDASAYCARRFEAWRRGATSQGAAETRLFEAYDAAARQFGRTRTDLVGPPRVYWTGDQLALEAEASRMTQRIKTGLFPTQLAGSQRLRIAPPWPEKVAWSAGNIQQDVPFGPAPSEVLLFDADSGALVARVTRSEDTADIAALHLVALSRSPFRSASFGDAIPSADPAICMAWVETEETLRFEDRADLALRTPVDAALWIDGTALGRDGSHALFACDGSLVLRIHPEIGGQGRIVRARHEGETRFASIRVGSDGLATLPFAEFGFDAPVDPRPVVFEVLAPGAAGDLDARAELSTACWIWPGVAAPQGDLENVPLPATFDPARSAGLVVEAQMVSVDPRSDVEAPILALRRESVIREFIIAARSEKLWHCRIAGGERFYVPRGATLTLGHENRHDTLLLRSPDRDASLIVMGKEKRRPFLQRQSLEIGAAEIESREGGDDRIALRRADGCVDLLARIRRIDDPAAMSIRETDDALRLAFMAVRPFDALRLRIEDTHGQSREGDHTFGRHPAPNAPLDGIAVENDMDTARVTVTLDKRRLPGPARALVHIRTGGDEDFAPLRDATGAPVALGLSGEMRDPGLQALLCLARFLSDPEPEALGGQLSAAIAPAYEAAFEPFARTRMLSPVRTILNVSRQDGDPPRHDLAGVAPWLFEAPLHAYTGLSEASGLSPLNRMKDIPSPATAPSIHGDTPAADWLLRLGSEDDIPPGLDAAALQHAFRILRYRMSETDLRILKGQRAQASTARLLCDTHVGELDLLRSFDQGGGGDLLPARLAALIERFARACAERRAATFIDDLEFRTGLSRREVGQSLTLILRAGVDFFVYFRALWTRAIEQDTSA